MTDPVKASTKSNTKPSQKGTKKHKSVDDRRDAAKRERDVKKTMDIKFQETYEEVHAWFREKERQHKNRYEKVQREEGEKQVRYTEIMGELIDACESRTDQKWLAQKKAIDGNEIAANKRLADLKLVKKITREKFTRGTTGEEDDTNEDDDAEEDDEEGDADADEGNEEEEKEQPPAKKSKPAAHPPKQVPIPKIEFQNVLIDAAMFQKYFVSVAISGTLGTYTGNFPNQSISRVNDNSNEDAHFVCRDMRSRKLITMIKLPFSKYGIDVQNPTFPQWEFVRVESVQPK